MLQYPTLLELLTQLLSTVGLLRTSELVCTCVLPSSEGAVERNYIILALTVGRKVVLPSTAATESQPSTDNTNTQHISGILILIKCPNQRTNIKYYIYIYIWLILTDFAQ